MNGFYSSLEVCYNKWHTCQKSNAICFLDMSPKHYLCPKSVINKSKTTFWEKKLVDIVDSILVLKREQKF